MWHLVRSTCLVSISFVSNNKLRDKSWTVWDLTLTAVWQLILLVPCYQRSLHRWVRDNGLCWSQSSKKPKHSVHIASTHPSSSTSFGSSSRNSEPRKPKSLITGCKRTYRPLLWRRNIILSIISLQAYPLLRRETLSSKAVCCTNIPKKIQARTKAVSAIVLSVYRKQAIHAERSPNKSYPY